MLVITYWLSDQCRSHSVTPMQIAERVIDFIRDTEKQSPMLRAIVQRDRDEILKVYDCVLTGYSGTPLIRSPTGLENVAVVMGWPY